MRRVSKQARHDRRLRDRRRDPGAEELLRRRRVRLGRLRHAGLHLDARDLDADLRARPGRLRAPRLPDQQAPAARGADRLPARPPPADLLGERLPGVQAARQRLRDGRPRYALPRPGHARGLRRALPRLRPRLLRLLRADGDAEHGLADEAAARARPRRRGRRAGLPHLQRRGVRGGAARMARARTKTIKTDYLARVEGEGAMIVRIDGGEVEDVKLNIYEPPRFFEAFLRGRAFTEAPDITARICGICPVAYQMSSCTAMEQACGVEVEGQLRALRRLLYCGEWIESHALHVYMLHLPDFLGYESAIELARDNPAAVGAGARAEEDRQRGNGASSAGREVHPINVRVGGWYRAPRKRELRPLVEKLERAREIALETVRLTAGPRLPRLRAGLRAGRAATSRASTRSSAAGSSRTAGSTSPSPSTTSTSSRSTSSGRTRSTRSCASAAPTSAGRWPASRSSADRLSPLAPRGGAGGRSRARRAQPLPQHRRPLASSSSTPPTRRCA